MKSSTRFLKLFFLLCLLFVSHLQGVQKSICLNMIVKNEKDVIKECLATVKPFIDYWVIVDTGSTDGTQQIIKEFMRGIPGELLERPWVDFAFNRNEAFAFAKDKADYLLLIDADEYFQYDPGFAFKNLQLDCYYFIMRQVGAVESLRPSLISAKLPWKWSGVLHEFLNTEIAKNSALITDISTIVVDNAPSGRFKDPNKYLNDVVLLENALKKEPKNSRYMFYLAQSYMAAQNFERALTCYEKRASMPSDDEQETFFAIYNVGQIKEKMGDNQEALDYFFKAYALRPSRAEPLFHAAVINRKIGKLEKAYSLSKQALTLSRPLDNCVEHATYDYGILIEFANCALLTGKWKEGLDASNKLLANLNLPLDIRPHVEKNRSLAIKNLQESVMTSKKDK
jgi:glycosyltransferase involved in cell wall biosynthesis